MQRYDLRHLKDNFHLRIIEIIDEMNYEEVAIFIFEIGEFSNVKKTADLIMQRDCEIMNSLKYNEVDWMIVAKKAHFKEKKYLKDFMSKFGVKTYKFDPNKKISIILGTFLHFDDEKLANLVQSSDEIYYLSAIEDSFYKNAKFIKFEIASELGVCAMIAKEALKDVKLPEDYKSFLDELDLGYLSAESSVGEEEVEELVKNIDFKNANFILGEDLNLHPDSEEIAKFLKLLVDFGGFNFVLCKELEIPNANISFKIKDIRIDENYDGSIIYEYKNSNSNLLLGSKQFAISSKIKDNDEVIIHTKNGVLKRKFKLDENLKGTVGILNVNEHSQNYRFEKVKIEVANG